MFSRHFMREGCGGHVVALPFNTFEKNIKRIAEANSEAQSRPTPKRQRRGHAQIIYSLIKFIFKFFQQQK